MTKFEDEVEALCKKHGVDGSLFKMSKNQMEVLAAAFKSITEDGTVPSFYTVEIKFWREDVIRLGPYLEIPPQRGFIG